MTRDEVKAVLAQLTGEKWLMASLLYGAGLRLTECLSLRVLSAVKRVHEKDLADGWGRVGGGMQRPISRAAITSTRLFSSGRCGTRSCGPD